MKWKQITTWCGSIVAALLASSCCWMPLVLVVLGISGSTAMVFFSRFRIPFLGVTILLLAIAFFFHYHEKRTTCCEAEKNSLRWKKRLNEISLWVAALIVIAVALYPNYYKHFPVKSTSETSEQCDNSNSVLENLKKLEATASEKSECCPQ